VLTISYPLDRRRLRHPHPGALEAVSFFYSLDCDFDDQLTP